MHARLVFLMHLPLLLPTPVIAQGANFQVTHAHVYQTRFGSREIYQEFSPDPAKETNTFFFAPALILDHDANGLKWKVSKEIDRMAWMQVEMRLFDEEHRQLAQEVVRSMYGDEASKNLMELPVKTMTVTWGGPDPLPDGVSFIEHEINKPSAELQTWIQLRIDPSIWKDDDDLTRLRQHLQRRKLNVVLVYDALNAKTNRILGKLSTDTKSELKATLNGISIPGKDGAAPYVTRFGERQFATAVRKQMELDYTIQDAALFEIDFINQILDVQFAQDELEWDVFNQQRQLSNYDCDDVRPDKVFERFQKEESGSDEVNKRRRKIGIAVGGGWGPFKAAAAADQDKDDYRSYAEKQGVIGEWVGEEFRPKKLRVKQVNEADLDILRSFTLTTRSVINATFTDPITLEIQNFRGPSEAQQVRQEALKAQRVLVERHLQEMRMEKEKRNSEIEKLRKAHKAERLSLQKRIDELTPKTEILSISASVDLIGLCKGCNEMDTARHDVVVNIRSELLIVNNQVRLDVHYKASRADQSCSIEGEHSQIVFDNPANRKIIQVIGSKFDSGDIMFGESHRKSPSPNRAPGIYHIQIVPPAHYIGTHWTEIQVCFDQAWRRAPELPTAGMIGNITFQVKVEK